GGGQRGWTEAGRDAQQGKGRAKKVASPVGPVLQRRTHSRADLRAIQSKRSIRSSVGGAARRRIFRAATTESYRAISIDSSLVPHRRKLDARRTREVGEE